MRGRFWWAGGTGLALVIGLPTGLPLSGPVRNVGVLADQGTCGTAPTPRYVEGGAWMSRTPIRSGILEDRPSSSNPAVPVRLQIRAIDVSARIVPVDVRRGFVEVPPGGNVGWYRFAGGFGRCGSTVLVAHVVWGSRYGVFFRLRDLEPGDLVTVHRRDGPKAVFRVTARRVYRKRALPDGVFRRTGRPALTLVTCGGPYSRATGHYLDNVVVYAVPRGSTG